jgi:hypothetical protein
MAEATGTSGASDQPPPKTANQLTLLSILQFLKDNLVVVSGLAALAGLWFSTIFLSAYLFVFDWRLIWFVQSADVVTVGLIAVGIMGSSLLLLYSISYNILTVRLPSGKLNWQLVGVGGMAAALILAFQIYGTHAGPNPRYFHLVSGWVTIFSVVILLPVIASHFTAGTWPTIPQLFGILFGAITATGSFGNWTALTVVESPEIVQDVVDLSPVFHPAMSRVPG